MVSEESWNLYDTYKQKYKWLSYSILVTAKYNCEINSIELDDVLALIQSESNGVVRAISSASAKGLMQIMNCHWKHAPEELYSIYLNIRLGTAYYKWCLDYANGNKREALRFYNAGPFSNKYVYKNYVAYCDVIIRNSNGTKNLKIKPVEVN
jgi:soluble lytic murein transglycosylase-like protein